MSYISNISLSLSVHSEHLSPDEITEVAGVSPTDSHCKGDAKGVVQKGNYESNYWSLQFKVRGEEQNTDSIHWFSDAVIRLLEQVPIDFIQKLSTLDSEIEAILWVGLFGIQDQGAFNIHPDVSKMLGEYDLELVFDMYIDHDSKVFGDAAWNK